MSRSPRFSVVIPTRNRARLLGGAIRSALQQTLAEFELVVVDNASSDGTRSVIQSFDDPRLMAVHSTTPRLMHDNWEFALQHARGDFVLYLCDDDALHPRLLEALAVILAATEADVACWRAATWYADDWPDPGQRGTMHFGAPYSDRVFDIDSKRLLDLAYEMRITVTDLAPRMLNTAVRRELALSAGAEHALFRPFNPDYSSMLALAARARRMVLLDAPLMASGATPCSVGASSQRRGDASRQFIREVLEREPALVLPAGPLTLMASIGQTYLQCARDFRAEHLGGRSLNWTHYFGLIGLEIEQQAQAGVDVADWRSSFEEALAGPMRARSDAILDFIRGRRRIESEDYLELRPAMQILGTGPRSIEGQRLTAKQAESIDVAAAAMDAWIVDSQPLVDLWDRAAQRCGPRKCVLLGLGLNGRALLRQLPSIDHPLRVRLRSHDDLSDLDPLAAPRLRAREQLSPREHFVVVTPANAADPLHRLHSHGFVRGRDCEHFIPLAMPPRQLSDPMATSIMHRAGI